MVLHHLDLGGAGRPPLLVLHGLLGSSRNWQTAGRDLAGDFHVFALDARNHGRSPHAAETTYDAMVDDVVRWMDAQGLAQAGLVGHSLGGKTAMRLACRFPERVAHLTVVDIAPKDYLSAAHRAEFAAMHELDLPSLTSRHEAELRLEARVPALGMRKFLTTNLERTADGGWRWAINLEGLTAALPELEKDSLGPGDHYPGPVLWITGGLSHYVGAGDHARILRHFPAARFEAIAGAGHNPHMDRREEFVRLVRRG